MQPNYQLSSIAAVGAAFLSSMPQPTTAQNNKSKDKPNIILIVADDMGYGDLACYGNQIVQTPNIDKLAGDGVRFTQAYAGSAICSPSRCCLLTGRNSGHGRIRDNFCKAGGLTGDKNGQTIRRMHLLETDTTLALMLHGAGYRSILINKWHQDGFNPNAGPLDRGFDEFKGWLITSPESNLPYYYPAKRYNNRQLVDVPENQNGAKGRHNNDISTDEAIQFVNENKQRPFFLYLGYDTPHEPYDIVGRGIYEKMPLSETAKTYAALVSHLDQNVGRLMQVLDNNKLRKNTLVIFISDNGGAVMAPHDELKCNGNLRGLKGNLYEGGIRIPMIASWPRRIPKHQVSDALVYFPDFMPTLAALAGGKCPDETEGISIVKALYGKEQHLENRHLYWEFPNQSQAVRWGKWKAIRPAPNKPMELYDLSTDLSEQRNVAADHPEIISEIEAFIKTARVDSENWPAPKK